MKKNVLLLLACLSLAGCATQSAKPPPGSTLAQIESMSQSHVSDAVIISQIQSSGAHYDLTADQIIALKAAGVSDNVVIAMIKTVPKPAVQTTTVVTPYPYVYLYPYPWGWWGPYYYYGGFYYRGGYYYGGRRYYHR
jgi:hypothetical protein